ncbi:hypothetical protein NQ318_017769 [Aromia moschata]|uniref:Uncharacterized protein n=1 Tax=Aromia moschata TaxID=1265417 RepID=A0AAV8XVA8_9CUCU|nr:hypothetical protein NQ318_017769 [Aromia moschata]
MTPRHCPYHSLKMNAYVELSDDSHQDKAGKNFRMKEQLIHSNPLNSPNPCTIASLKSRNLVSLKSRS